MCIIGKCDTDALIRIVLILGLKLSYLWIFFKEISRHLSPFAEAGNSLRNRTIDTSR